jgi:hypothetical protein
MPAPVAPAAGWTDDVPAASPSRPASRADMPAPPQRPPSRVDMPAPSRPASRGEIPTSPQRPPSRGDMPGPLVATVRPAKDAGPKEERKKTPAQLAAPRWKKARAGLWWVLFGLLWLALPGFVPFGVAVYERAYENLPDGKGWVEIEGYVNDPQTAGTLKFTKRQEIMILAYGVPILLGAAAVTLGRMTCGAVPRSSGAKGMFVLSALFTFIGVGGLVSVVAAYHLDMKDELRYILAGWVIVFLMTEGWFLTGMAVCGAALKRPRGARPVGLVVLVAGLVAGLGVAALGHDSAGNEWEVQRFNKKDDYAVVDSAGAGGAAPAPGGKQGGKGKGKGKGQGVPFVPKADPPEPKAGAELPKGEPLKVDPKKPEDWVIWVRHNKVDEETWIAKSAGVMIGWLLLIGVYWRAVAATRWAIRDALEQADAD